VLKTKTVHTDVVVIGVKWRSAAGIKVKNKSEKGGSNTIVVKR
jgi:hypothetical protein